MVNNIKRITICLICIILLTGCQQAKSPFAQDESDNPQMVLFLTYLDWESFFFRGYFIDSEGKKHYCDLSELEDLEFDTKATYEYLYEHFNDYPGENFLSKYEVQKCIDYIDKVDVNAKVIESEFIACGMPGVILDGVRMRNGEPEFVRIRENGAANLISEDKYTKKIIDMLGDDWDIGYEH